MLNPPIEPVDNFSKHYGYDNGKEILIKRLHLIWIGSSITYTKYKENIKKWAHTMFDCKFDIYFWYDSNLFTDHDNIMAKFINELNKNDNNNIYLCDIRHYKLFDINIQKNRPKKLTDDMFNIYEREIGIANRPNISSIAKNLKNWGMATDILRIMILDQYGGFYVDVDMVSVNLCNYNDKYGVKTCTNRFCASIADSGENTDPTQEVFHAKHINNALYYNPIYDVNHSMITKFMELGLKKYNEVIVANPYYYILLSYRLTTIKTFGPGNYIDTLGEINELKADQYWILYGFREDKILSSHTWYIPYEKYGTVIDMLLYECLSDINRVYSCKSFLLNIADIENSISIKETIVIIDVLKLILAHYPDIKIVTDNAEDIDDDNLYSKQNVIKHAKMIPGMINNSEHYINRLYDQLYNIIYQFDEPEVSLDKVMRKFTNYINVYDKYLSMMVPVEAPRVLAVEIVNIKNDVLNSVKDKLEITLYNNKIPSIDFYREFNTKFSELIRDTLEYRDIIKMTAFNENHYMTSIGNKYRKSLSNIVDKYINKELGDEIISNLDHVDINGLNKILSLLE